MVNWHAENTIFENISHTNDLVNFRRMLVGYFNNVHYATFGGDGVEGDTAKILRPKINENLAHISAVVLMAGVDTSMQVMRAPVAGGGVYRLDLFGNVFNLRFHDVSPNTIIDMIDQAIGTYKKGKAGALLRTINPLWWVWRAIGWISSLPFKIVGKAGFNQRAVENSRVGRLFKMALEAMVTLVAVLQIDAFVFHSRIAAYLQSILPW